MSKFKVGDKGVTIYEIFYISNPDAKLYRHIAWDTDSDLKAYEEIAFELELNASLL